MTKPTGRPRGRPKTKEYATLMARVPQDLAERVKHYAGEKQQTISDVLRDGLLVLLETEDPRQMFLSYTNAVPAIMSDKKATSIAPAAEIMSDTKAEEKNVSDRKSVASEIVSDKNGSVPKTETASQSHDAPAFDTTKYVLGKLCPRQHDYHGTRRSLLRLSNRHCLACDREKFHERKQAKRQAQHV